MLSITAATLGLGLVIFLPGLTLVWLFARKKTPWWEAAAVAPAVGLGFVYVVAEIASSAELRFDVPIFAAATTGLAVATGVSIARRHAGDTGARIAWPERSDYAAIGLLIAAIAIGSVIWVAGLRGVEVPPNQDSAHHGLFTAQIDRFGTIDADRVLVSSNADTEPVNSFYPLALHSAAALVSGPLPTSIADIWLVYAALFAAVVFPIGVFALTRVLFLELPLAAGFAAFLAPMFALFPYKPIAWGGIALIAGLAMMPGVVVAASTVLTLPLSIRRALYVALALVGLFASHSSELPLAVVLALLIAAMSIPTIGLATWLKRILTNGAIIGLFSVGMLAPVAVPVFRGGNERLAFDDTPLAPLDATIRTLVNLRAYTGQSASILAILAGLGALVALVRRTALIWLVAGMAIIALYVTTSVSDNPLAAALSVAFYRQPERVLYNVVFWLLPFAGLALGAATIWVTRRFERQWMTRVSLATITLAVFMLMLPSIRPIAPLVRSWTFSYSTVGANEIAAFEYLGSVTNPDESVLTDLNTDGSLWMYALAGVDPLFLVGVPRLESLTIPDSIVDSHESRTSLASGIASYRARPDIAQRLSDAGIRFVYYDETGFLGSPRILSFQSLRTDPAFIPVFDQGPAHVYRIDYDILRAPERSTVSRQVLRDGGFDAGLSFWAPDSQAASWSVNLADNPAISVSDVAGQSVLYAVASVPGYDPTWDVIAISPGESYTVEFSLTTEVDSSGEILVGLSFFDAAGNWISTAATGTGELAQHEPDTWHRFSDGFEAPAGAVSAIPVVVATDVEGEARIDGLDLRILYG